MSNLTLTDGSLRKGGETSDRDLSGVAAAFANIDGTGTPSLGGDDLNVGSIVDNSSGDYTINFTSNMNSSAYVYVTGAPANNISDNRANMNLQVSDAAGTATLKSTSQIRVIAGGTTSSAPADRANVCAAVFGSLA